MFLDGHNELLPKYIKNLLKYNFMEIEDFSFVKEIYIKYLYE